MTISISINLISIKMEVKILVSQSGFINHMNMYTVNG
jgi:hypothetical protein